jgi:hypothetical protein
MRAVFIALTLAGCSAPDAPASNLSDGGPSDLCCVLTDFPVAGEKTHLPVSYCAPDDGGGPAAERWTSVCGGPGQCVLLGLGCTCAYSPDGGAAIAGAVQSCP